MTGRTGLRSESILFVQESPQLPECGPDPLDRIFPDIPKISLARKETNNPVLQSSIAMNNNISPGTGLLDRFEDRLFKIFNGKNPKIRDGKINDVEPFVLIKGSQIAACLSQAFFVVAEKYDDGDTLLFELR